MFAIKLEPKLKGHMGKEARRGRSQSGKKKKMRELRLTGGIHSRKMTVAKAMPFKVLSRVAASERHRSSPLTKVWLDPYPFFPLRLEVNQDEQGPERAP
ncbi:MAG: hypothetical protein HQL76_10145 [Magnetococcales bacterium]|nr:hypothetical protein [Magnetococcales bacterium]